MSVCRDESLLAEPEHGDTISARWRQRAIRAGLITPRDGITDQVGRSEDDEEDDRFRREQRGEQVETRAGSHPGRRERPEREQVVGEAVEDGEK